MTSLLADIRYATRTLLQRPGFTALAVLTLALGIGVTTVAFNAISALVLRPFSVPGSDRLGWIMLTSPGNPRGQATSEAFDTLVRGARSFDRIEAEARVPVALRRGAASEQAWSLAVSSTYLDTFSVPITLGRRFGTADLAGSDIPVVISHRFWSEKLGAPASLAGLTVNAAGRVVSVIGVVDDAYQGPGGLFAPDMWLPLDRLATLQVERREPDRRWLTLFGRLKEGVTGPQAEAELAALTRRDDSSQAAEQDAAQFHAMRDGHPDLREIGPITWMAFAVVNIVLLIACFNLSSLLIARSAERQGEIAIRTALGASRARVLQQLLTESLLLATAAGAASVLVASWSGYLLATFSLPAPIPQRLHLEVSWLVVAFTAVATVVGGILPALLPALAATAPGRVRSVRSETGFGSRSRTRSLFVVAQIAGATAFVLIAALFARTFVKTSAVDPGFDADHLAVVELDPADHGYDTAESARIIATFHERASGLPGVVRTALADRVPFYVGQTRTTEYAVEGADCAAAKCPTAGTYTVGADYFAAMGIPIREGRDLTAADISSGSAVVISEQLARTAWPNESALGRVLRLGDAGRPVQVVGVAANIRHRNLAEPDGAYVFEPLGTLDPASRAVLIVRSERAPEHLLGPLRQALSETAADIPPAALVTMRERMKMPLWAPRATAGFFLICGTLALVLATIGLFGVMYFTVAQRTREFGIRVAIGASRAAVMRGVLGEGLRLALPGVAVGIALGVLAGRVLSSALFGVGAADPVSVGGAAALQVLVALAACAVPAYRATTADPIRALRQE
jgi:predicted permease